MATEREEEESNSTLIVSDLAREQADNDQTNEDGVEETDKPLLCLKSCREWLELQRLDYQAELKTKRTMEQEELEFSKPLEPNTLKLYQSISSLQQQLLDISSSRSTKKLVLERLQLSHEMKKLFTTDEGVGDNKSSKGLFIQRCDEQSESSKEILKYHQALEEEQSTLKETQRQCMEVTKANQEVMKQLQELKLAKDARQTQKESQAVSSVRKQIVDLQDMITVVSNIYQALVVGSDINWAEDENVREMVLHVGKTCNFLES